jgi:hypothetical protein
MTDFEAWVRDYLKQKGIDPDKLDDLSEKELREITTDGQIDAYLKGQKDATTTRRVTYDTNNG